jgi:hypothetical protein
MGTQSFVDQRKEAYDRLIAIIEALTTEPNQQAGTDQVTISRATAVWCHRAIRSMCQAVDYPESREVWNSVGIEVQAAIAAADGRTP